MSVLARPSLAPLVPNETRKVGALLVPNRLMSLRCPPPGADLATAQQCSFRVLKCLVTRLRKSANREKTSVPPFLPM